MGVVCISRKKRRANNSPFFYFAYLTLSFRKGFSMKLYVIAEAIIVTGNVISITLMIWIEGDGSILMPFLCNI